VALNMIDVAESQGLRIDVAKLSHSLGVPGVPIQANRKIGLDRLRETIAEQSRKPQSDAGAPFPAAFDAEVDALHKLLKAQGRPSLGFPLYLVRRLLLDAGGYTEKMVVEHHGEHVRAMVAEARQRLAAAGCGVPAVEAKARYGWIRHLT